MEKEKKKANLIIKIGRRIKIRHLLLLGMLFIANSYAWFIFSTKVSVGTTAHVATWDIEFTAGDGEQLSYMVFDVDRIYPGMEEASSVLFVTNTGTEPAILSYEISYVRIFDDEYEIDDDTTSEMLEYRLTDMYPFKFAFIPSSNIIASVIGAESFKITLNWDYESGDDEEDTYWGESAYEYYATSPDDPAIEVKLLVRAIQELPEEEGEP